MILIECLAGLDVCHNALKWFQNRVKHDDLFTDWGTVKGGSPQGSTLGPLLFLIYVNDMPLQISSRHLLQFADDTALICSGKFFSKVVLVMQDQLLYLYHWISSNRMELNVVLCGFL